MNSELSNHASESDQTKMHNSETENFKKSEPCRSPKVLGQQPGPQERSCLAKSLNTALVMGLACCYKTAVFYIYIVKRRLPIQQMSPSIVNHLATLIQPTC